MNQLVKILQRARKSSDVVLAVAMAAVLGAMIIPDPRAAYIREQVAAVVDTITGQGANQ